MIIETSGNKLYSVTPYADAALAHVWQGVEVKLIKGEYVAKAKAKPMMIRKAATHIVREG